MLNNNKALLIITDGFPYGSSNEAFLENELSMLEGQEVYFLPTNRLDGVSRIKLKENWRIIDIPNMKAHNKVLYFFGALFSSIFWNEIVRMIRYKKITLIKILELMLLCIKIKYLTNTASKQIKCIEKTITVYSFWCYTASAVGISLKKKFINIDHVYTRANGYDVFDERHNNNFMMLREYIYDNCDTVFFASKYAMEYTEKKYPKYINKYEYSHLGTRDYGQKVNDNQNRFVLVSCSNVIPLKQVMLIAQALSLVKQIEVEWVHIGDGSEMKDLEKYCQGNLPSYIKYKFLGQVANSDLMEWYKRNNVSFFITATSTEGGIPVSLMEASSFGIPMIAPKVGGCPEIVNNDNGILLPAKLDVDLVFNAITKAYKIWCDKDKYENMCRNARTTWAEEFNASEVYHSFYTRLLK